jgi:hypothetical protein
MLMVVLPIIVLIAALAALGFLARAGFRHGDRPGDARISARLAGRPGTADPDRAVTVTVRNPSGTPVLAGLRVSRAVLPAWLAGAGGVRVPRWTRRRALRPGRFPVIGAVRPADAARYTLPVPPKTGPVRGRTCLLTVVVGQEGGRLRAYRLRLEPDCYTTSGRGELIMVG